MGHLIAHQQAIEVRFVDHGRMLQAQSTLHIVDQFLNLEALAILTGSLKRIGKNGTQMPDSFPLQLTAIWTRTGLTRSNTWRRRISASSPVLKLPRGQRCPWYSTKVSRTTETRRGCWSQRAIFLPVRLGRLPRKFNSCMISSFLGGCA